MALEHVIVCAGVQKPAVGSPEPSSEPSAPSKPITPTDDVKKEGKPSVPIAVQHFKAPDVPSNVKPEVPTTEIPEAVKKPQAAVVDTPSASGLVTDVAVSAPVAPEDTASTAEEQPDAEGKKKKSRFGLPSFMSSSGRKSKKEKPTGVQPNILFIIGNVLGWKLCYNLPQHVFLPVL